MREPHEFEVPLCAQVGGDLFFPDLEYEGKLARINIASAKSICRECQHITECAEWGIRKEHHGIWGGMTGSERRKIRRLRNIRLEEDKSA
jgi:WhiB family redox-sensing transcriptional regulator